MWSSSRPEVDWIETDKIEKLDERLREGRRVDGIFAGACDRDRSMRKSASEYWASNCSGRNLGRSASRQIPISGVVWNSGDQDGFVIGADRAMFGVDYPHFESIFPNTETQVGATWRRPSRASPSEVARKILCENAARVYGFDLERLPSPTSERVGFDI